MLQGGGTAENQEIAPIINRETRQGSRVVGQGGGPIRDGRNRKRGRYRGDELETVERVALSSSNLRSSKFLLRSTEAVRR